jgi:ubiquinol-cytochrome c reductase cytochrome b subunit
MMATSFIGYVLPWGQMSFWGATVITNLFTAIPIIGDSLSTWIWGGFSISKPTLSRFFAIHYILPFIILALVFVHLILLHNQGSSNPLQVSSEIFNIRFYPYFFLKDLHAFSGFFLVSIILIFFYPEFFMHSDNYIKANALVTPVHIVPE